jgi:predicted kinase
VSATEGRGQAGLGDVRQPAGPLLIVFAGPPCAGKSTAAGELSRRLGISCLSMDGTRQRILPGAAHTRADRQAAYRAMHFAAELLLRNGGRVILDAPYGHAEDRMELRRIVAACSVRFCLVECRVSPETAVRRFQDRRPDPERPDLTAAVVAQAAREYPYTGSGLVLEMDDAGPEDAVRRVCEWLGIPASPPQTET